MKHRKGSVKKITAMLLAVLMVVTTVQLPAPERAEASTTTCTEEGCGGTYVNGFCSADDTHYEAPELNSEGYYEIGNAGELYWFAAHVNAGNLTSNAVLTEDIVVNEGTMTAESTGVREWVPIGNSMGMTFSGLFDGQGHSVSGLYFNDKTVSNVGLFGCAKGVIENVGVIESYIYGSGNVGGIVGQGNGTIRNCYNASTINSKNTLTGGIVGAASGCFIERCYNNGTIVGGNQVAGGIAGLGANGFTIRQCFNMGKVSGTARAGGIVGDSRDTSRSKVEYCYNIGEIFANIRNEGIVGSIVGCVNNYNPCIDCFYLSESAKNGNDSIHNGVGGVSNENAKLTDEEGKTIPFETAALTSGEICYLLNNGVTDGTQAFYQTVGSGMPTFLGETVYYGYEDCGATEKTYANTPLATEVILHTYDNDCDWYCNVCDTRRDSINHTYDNACDTDCNVCGQKRTTTHDFSCECGMICQVCGEVESQNFIEEFPSSVILEMDDRQVMIWVYPKCQTCGKYMTKYRLNATTSQNYSGKNSFTLSYSASLKSPKVVWEGLEEKPIEGGEYNATIIWYGQELDFIYKINPAIYQIDASTVSVAPIENTLSKDAVQFSCSEDIVDGRFTLNSTKLYYGTNEYIWKFIPTETNNYKECYGTVSITVKDTIAPYATYQIGDGTAKQFGTTQQNGVVSKNTQTVNFNFYDQNNSGEDGSGIKTKQYYLSNTWIEDMTSITTWNNCPSQLNLVTPGQYYIYVKVTDNQDNVFLGVSERIVIYKDSTISSSAVSYVYKENRDVTLTLSLNGNTIKEVCGGRLTAEDYTINGDTVTIKASYMDTVSAGSYTYWIMLNPQGVDTEENAIRKDFTLAVSKALLTVTAAVVEGKVYNGSNVVTVTDVTLQGVRGSDNVEIDMSRVRGTLSSANAGEYTEVLLENLVLTGDQHANYQLKFSKIEVPTTVVIQKREGYANTVNRQYLYLRSNSDNIGLARFLPTDCGEIQYGVPQVQGNVSFKEMPVIVNGELTYTVDAGEVDAVGTIVVPVVMENYEDTTITVKIKLTDQKKVVLKDSAAIILENNTLTFGESLGSLQFNEVVFVDEAGNEVPGTLSFVEPDMVPDTRVQQVAWTFVPDNEEYFTVSDYVAITVNKATPYIGALPVASDIVYGETLAQSVLSGGEVWHSAPTGQIVEGTFSWKDSAVSPTMRDGGVTGYAVIFTPADTANYNTVETAVTININKKSGEYTGFVERQYLYLRENSDSINLAGLLPADCGAVEYGTPIVAGAVTCPATPEINGGVLYYTVNPGECNASGTITIPVTMENCQDIEIVVSILLNDRKSVYLQGSLLPFNTLTYGEPVSVLTLGDVTFTDEAGNPVPGTLSWANPDYVPDAGEQYAGWVFTPDSIEYYPFSGTVRITVNKATPYVTDLPVASDIVYGETLAQSGLSGGAVTHSETVAQDVAGSFEWKDAGITPTLADSGVTGYIVVFTPVDSVNYNKVEATVVLSVNPVMPDVGGEVAPEAPNEPNEPTEPNEPVDPCAHGETEVRNAVAASCTASGYTGDVHCKSCGELQVRGTVTAATGHRYTGYVAKQPTTEAEGTYVYSCMYCGSSYGETIAKLPASEPEEPKEEPKEAEVAKIERKTSWSFITKDLKKAEEGTTFTVDMNGTTAVPLKALRAIRNKDVTLEIRITKDLVWSINGKKLPKILRGDMECGVLLNPSQEDTKTVIPKNLLRETAKGNAYVTMHLDHEGKFGFEALLSVMFGEEKEGSFANLFYFNEKAGTLEFADADKIRKDGKATFTFTHASEYVIVFADVSLEPEEPQMPEEPELKEPEEPQKPEPVVPEKKDLKQVAKEVINGRWGNGETRKKRLTEAGYDYKEVQKTVNELLK